MDFIQTALKMRFFKMHWSFPYRIKLTQEKMILMTGVLIISLMGSFVLWGPSQKRRRKIRSATGVNGLVNMGETCFLNTLLQAIAASPLFCEWLKKNRQQSDIALALHQVIQYVNCGAVGEVPSNPQSVVSAMSAHGWSIGVGQQDSHELFFALMMSLKEQTSQSSKPQDIIHQLGKEGADNEPQKPTHVGNGTVAMLQDTNEESLISEDSITNEADADVIPEVDPVERYSFVCRIGGRFQGSNSHQKTDFPFRGQQLSQLTCNVCARSSVVQHQAFDCLTLTLPSNGTSTLYQMLASFTAPEQVHDVTCDHCTLAASTTLPVKTTFIKQMSIGKLPKCFCIHIQRTSWLSYGRPHKRDDFIAFPELLAMDKFTYYYKERIRRALLEEFHLLNKMNTTNDQSLLEETTTEKKEESVDDKVSSRIENSEAKLRNGDVKRNCDTYVAKSQEHINQFKDKLVPKHLYKLQSVIVHLGEASHGHFLTYRRLPPNSSEHNRWVCVSDEDCYLTTVEKVLSSRAYMLFYEKI